ncbi:hypothetical protein DPMN_179048 [Dreissena polymorpha]|uniref:Uncharacterized protein n=1 Tax=Dreissena polymorpha TaxID=45954 RepID=A0A9D4EG81_DREPO|nr:hypothetical protein DPMN_179048 [Dreissena polymorpha]
MRSGLLPTGRVLPITMVTRWPVRRVTKRTRDLVALPVAGSPVLTTSVHCQKRKDWQQRQN